MNAVLLSLKQRPGLRMIDAAHRFVLDTIAEFLALQVPGVERRGTSDLAIGNRKFSGNSMRVAHDWLLYHGTVLYDFPIDSVARYLKLPPRRPEYRGERSHAEFLRNLPLPREAIRRALIGAFHANEPQTDWPRETVAELVATKYSQRAWNYAL
jgi:lipoate-protein ligase A